MCIIFRNVLRHAAFLSQVIAAILICIALFEISVLAQDETIRIDTNLVTVPVSVFDRDGRYYTTLKQGDFKIFEDGVEQELSYFSTVDEPVTVLLLLDVSGSMEFHVSELANAASIFLHQLRRTDRLGVGTFSDHLETLIDFQPVEDIRGKKIVLRLDGSPKTMIYDVMETGMKKMRRIPGRKAIVLFSDGIGFGYSASAKSNLRDAMEQEALIYSINFDTTIKTRKERETEREFRNRIKDAEFAKTYMAEISQVTGGRGFQIEKIGDLSRTFGEVSNELGRQYCLGYYPSKLGKGGEKRKISVRVSLPNLAVRSRNEVVYNKLKK